MFKQDLATANLAEAHTVQVFKNANIQAWLNPSQDYDGLCAYDLGFYNGREWLVEQKLDWYSMHSPNFAIEQPTLEHTKAHYWIHIEPVPYILTLPSVKELFNSYPKKLVGDQGLIAAMVPKVAFKLQAKPLWKFIKDQKYDTH